MAKSIMQRLKFDNDTINRVCRLVEAHDWTINAKVKYIRRYMNKIGEDLFPDIFELNFADTLGQSEYKKQEKLELIDELKEAYEGVVRRGECVSLRTLAVTGNDLIKLGIKPGPEIGEILNRLLNAVIEDPSLNTKEALIKMI